MENKGGQVAFVQGEWPQLAGAYGLPSLAQPQDSILGDSQEQANPSTPVSGSVDRTQSDWLSSSYDIGRLAKELCWAWPSATRHDRI